MTEYVLAIAVSITVATFMVYFVDKWFGPSE